jgi:hypothetical protein
MRCEQKAVCEIPIINEHCLLLPLQVKRMQNLITKGGQAVVALPHQSPDYPGRKPATKKASQNACSFTHIPIPVLRNDVKSSTPIRHKTCEAVSWTIISERPETQAK